MLKRVGDAHSRNNELNNKEIVTLLDRWTLQIESKYRKQITVKWIDLLIWNRIEYLIVISH